MHATFPYVSIHSPTRTRLEPATTALRLRGFETGDLSNWQRLLHEGYDLQSWTVTDEDVRRCLTRLGEEGSGQLWPTGGIHVLESEDQVMCMVRVMLFPSHAELRTARVTSRDGVEPLIELVLHTLRQAHRTGLRRVVMGQDASPEQSRLIAGALGWTMTQNDGRVMIHLPHDS